MREIAPKPEVCSWKPVALCGTANSPVSRGLKCVTRFYAMCYVKSKLAESGRIVQNGSVAFRIWQNGSVLGRTVQNLAESGRTVQPIHESTNSRIYEFTHLRVCEPSTPESQPGCGLFQVGGQGLVQGVGRRGHEVAPDVSAEHAHARRREFRGRVIAAGPETRGARRRKAQGVAGGAQLRDNPRGDCGTSHTGDEPHVRPSTRCQGAPGLLRLS